MNKKIVSAALCSCILLQSAVMSVFASDCYRYSGDNIETQNYENWGESKNTFLTDCGDGTFMKFQSDAKDNYYIAEYYSSDMSLLSTKNISTELPLFGTFYATNSNYYILSGQTNESQSNETEVFRITKYSKNWKKISSVGLNNCNTTNPFDAGVTSIAESGGYLIIRTSHEMYADSNGIHHEANLTMQIDESTMQITDYNSNVSNSKNGYVSHSFNQFVKIENNKIVTIDHGDAHPRSIVLMEYPTDITTGKFSSKNVSSTDLLTFDGTNGDNYTGASVGGFEISDSAYLVAYNQIEYEGYDWSLSRGTSYVTLTSSNGDRTVYQLKQGAESRNVYIAVKDKSGNTVTLNKISNCSSSKTASTPHLVKINNNRYLVVWSEYSVVEFTNIYPNNSYSGYYCNLPDNKVYYTEIDANGNKVGSTYSFRGNLSDCQPIVFDGNVMWNTWTDNSNTFYKIDISDISQNSKSVVSYQHSSEEEGKIIKSPNYEENGIIEYTCDYCGENYTESIPKLTGIIGDANEDGVINIQDATLVQKYVVHYKVNINIGLADYDGDKRITIKDATKIQKKSLGLI